MGEYYKLKLNCARTKINYDKSVENGVLNIGIEKMDTKRGMRTEEEHYVFGPDYLVAKKVGDHFEELFFGLKINYDPEGIHEGIESSATKKYDVHKLHEELSKGITCFEYSKIKQREVNRFMNSIQLSGVTMKNYRNELDFLCSKETIHAMLRKNGEEETKGISRIRKR